MTESAIACSGLTKRFRRGFDTFVAVDGLDLVIPRGSTFGLLGPNGAGKTTTIQMLLGLVRPSGGSASLLGRPIGTAEARRKVGYVPEKFQLPPFMTATEFLELHGELFGLSGAALRARIEEVLTQVNLLQRRKDRVSGFSKGMQQRLVLAQALLNEPELLILDEPTSALDPVGRKEVRDIIRQAHARGATVLLNSHLLSEVEAVCDQVAVLRNGKLLAQGPIRELAGQALQVTLRVGRVNPAVDAAIEALAQVRLRVAAETETGEVVSEVSCEVPSEAVLPRLAAAVLAAGGDLYALTPHTERLEDTFLRLLENA